MVPCALDLSYYTQVKMAAIDETIAAAMSKFVGKVINNENEHLQCHAINLMDNLVLLWLLFLRKYNLISIVPNIRFLQQACTIGK